MESSTDLPDFRANASIRAARAIVYGAMRLYRRLQRRDNTYFLPDSPHDPSQTLYGRLIQKYAPGRSFVDICCMWGMHGAVSYYAEAYGAAKVTAFDGMDPTPEFLETHRQKQSRVSYVKGNLDAIQLKSVVGTHDVAWCTGLLYHTPDPFRVLSDVLSVANEYAIIGSKTIPNIPGIPNAAVFLPGLDCHERSRLVPFWGENLKRPFGTLPAWDYEWWWLLSGRLIASMIEARPEWKVVEIHHRARSGLNDDCVVVAKKRPAIGRAQPTSPAALPDARGDAVAAAGAVRQFAPGS